MLRLLGLMPSLEPTEQEKAEARILEQTGYTSETIEGFKQQIRDRESQLRQVEEGLTMRILLLQKERDEALLGQGVGLSTRTPLPPASEDALSPAAAGGESDRLADGSIGSSSSSSGLAHEQIQHYESQIDQLHAHIQQMQVQMEQNFHIANEQQQQQQQQPYYGDGSYAASSTSPNSSSAYSSPAADASAAALRDFSARLSARTSQAEELRGELDRVTLEKEQLEKHLAGVLASPAISNISSPHMQYPSNKEEAGEVSSNEEVATIRAQMAEVNRQSEEQRNAFEQQIDEEQQKNEQLLRQQQEMEQQLQYAQQQLQQQLQQPPTSADGSADSAATSHLHQRLSELDQQVFSQTQHLAHLQFSLQQAESHAIAADAEVARLQAELMRVQSADQQPPVVSSTDSAEVMQLQNQIVQLQQQLSQQAATAADEKKRTQQTLAEKLTQVKTVIQSKDSAIAQLKLQLQACQTQLQQRQQMNPITSNAEQKYSQQAKQRV